MLYGNNFDSLLWTLSIYVFQKKTDPSVAVNNDSD